MSPNDRRAFLPWALFSALVVALVIWQTAKVLDDAPPAIDYDNVADVQPRRDTLAQMRTEAVALLFRLDSLPYSCPRGPAPCRRPGPALVTGLLDEWGGKTAVWLALRTQSPETPWPMANGPLHPGSRLGEAAGCTLITLFVADSTQHWHEAVAALPIAGGPMQVLHLNGGGWRGTVNPGCVVILQPADSTGAPLVFGLDAARGFVRVAM